MKRIVSLAYQGAHKGDCFMGSDGKQIFSAKVVLALSKSDGNIVTIGEELRKELQEMLLSMFLDIQTVCKMKGISVYLCGGSALGAVRHKGFIPWDDDLDITMTREDYTRFETLFEENLADRYCLKAPNYKEGSRSRFPKIMKKGTVFRELGDPSPSEECGVFLDIFILDNVPDSKLIRVIKGSICNILEFISGQVLVTEEKADILQEKIKKASKLQYYIRKVTGVLFSFRTAKEWNRTLDKWIQYPKESQYGTLATGRRHYFGESLPKSVFLPGSRGSFEGHDVLLFTDTDAYLSNLYGDYMKIPEESKREKHIVEEIKLKGEV